jgi:hypothetical protein
MKTPEELVKDSKHFCVLPWIHFHAWPDKNVLPCCVADSNHPVSKIEDDKSILEMMNSDEYKKMRTAMLADERYEPCSRCYDLEELGTWTMRQSQNTVRGMDNIIAVEDTNEDGSIDEFKLKYMDIRFSNLCNFKCRSCGPACSNLWGEEKMREMEGDKNQFEIAFRLKDILVSNTDNNDFMSKLKGHLPEVEECYFAGGEILVQPQHYECLDYWVDNNLQHNVHLNYTTNLSKLNFKDKGRDLHLFDYWNKGFKDIEIWASLDAMGDHADIIRSGSNWKRIVENLKLIKEKAPHVKLGFTPTISMWNIWSYSDLFDYLHDEGLLDMHRPPRLNILTNPEWASIENLPTSIAAPLINKYEKQMERYCKMDNFADSDAPQHLGNTFKVLLTALKKCRGDADQLKEFINQNQRMDNSRNEDLLDVIPELEDVFKWAMSQDN